MPVSQDNDQRMAILGGAIGDAINIIMATFLIVFIPMSIMIDLTHIQMVVLLILNTACFTVFLGLFLFEIKRELWLINHLDYSKRYNSVHLATYKDQYPAIFDELAQYNFRYFIFYIITKWVFFINFFTSSFIIIYFYYLDYKTITSLVLSFWFSYSKIRKGLRISKDSLEVDSGFSYYNTLSLSFNRIDTKFKQHYSSSNIESLNSSFREEPKHEETHL